MHHYYNYTNNYKYCLLLFPYYIYQFQIDTVFCKFKINIFTFLISYSSIMQIFFLRSEIIEYLILSSSGSRPCPGQLLKTSRSTETQRHSLVSGLDLEIDSIITPYHHHPPTHHPPENFFEQNNIEISSFMNSLVIVHSKPY